MKRILLTISFVFFGFFSPAQNKSDFIKYQQAINTAKDDTSRINALREMGKQYSLDQTDSAIIFSKQALQLAEKIGWTKGIAQNALNLGYYQINSSKYDSGIYYETKALAAAKIAGDKNRIALIYVNRGSAYIETQQYQKGMSDIKEAIRLSEETGNKDRLSRALESMGELYMYQDNAEAALPWAEKALQLEKEIGDEGMQSASEMMIGGIYLIRKDYKKAEAYLLDAVGKAERNDRPDIIAECCMTLSSSYIENHLYDKAIVVAQKGIGYAKSLQMVDRAAALYQNLGNAFYSNEQYGEALNAHREGYKLVKGQSAFQKNQYVNLEGMAQSYNALGDFKNAFQAARLASDIKDSALRNERDEKLLRLQAEFETERKEKQIALLQKNQQLARETMEKQRTFQYAAYIIFFLLLLLTVLIINRYRIKQRAKRYAEIEQMRNSIARNLHDDIGSTLTSINILSKVALQQTGMNNAATNIQKIKDRSATIMESMNDIVWAINPANDALDKIILRMKEFGAETAEQSGMNFIFKEEGNIDDVKLSPAQRNNLYLIFKEALNNAVKYSAAKTIQVFLKKEERHLILKVADDGKGFDMQQQFSGNGLKNMRSRAAEIHATVQLESAKNTGTTTELIIGIT